jgi:hypothetical protein
MQRHSFKNKLPNGGATMVETLVALTLLTTILSVFVPLIARHGRLLVAQREYRLALDELSNQLERLSALPRQELPGALEKLQPSAYAVARLPGAELRGELTPADLGQRLTLRLAWGENKTAAAPATLAAWIYPPPSSVVGTTREGEAQ